jgi:hypothetical protein
VTKDGRWLKCCTCGSDFWLPQELHEAALKGRENLLFYCAYGHPQTYISREKEAETNHKKEAAAEAKRHLEALGKNIISIVRN